MRNEERFVDPFELPRENKSEPTSQGMHKDDERSDCYDLDLHDNFDWLAQPCTGLPHELGRGGRANES